MRIHATLWACLLLAALLTAQEKRAVNDPRFTTNRKSRVKLRLPSEDPAFTFAIVGDRTGGPASGIRILENAVEDLNTLGPDFVITVGDMVQGYNTTLLWLPQMAEYRQTMSKLRMPWFPVAGNHDIYWRGLGRPAREHEADYEAHFGPLWYAFRHKKAWFIALYSDEGDPQTGRKSFTRPAAQRMSPEQFAWLQQVLKRAHGAEHVFLFLHHPRWLEGGYGKDWQRVHKLLRSAGNVRAVFAGHIHRMLYSGKRDGIEYFTLATTGGGQNGTLPKAGYLHQYHLVTVRKKGIDVTALPVGAPIDPRKITEELARGAQGAARALRPRFLRTLRYDMERGSMEMIEVQLRNPVDRPVELTLRVESGDPRWYFGGTSAHKHFALPAKSTQKIAFRAVHEGRSLDGALRAPRLVVEAEYLGKQLRVPLPRKDYYVPFRPVALPDQDSAKDRFVRLGASSSVRSLPGALKWPKGAFTIECKASAPSFRTPVCFLSTLSPRSKGGTGFVIYAQRAVPYASIETKKGRLTLWAQRPMLRTGRQTRIALVYDGTEYRLYVGGKLAAKRPGAPPRPLGNTLLHLGAEAGSLGHPGMQFRCDLDEIRISSRARYVGKEQGQEERFQADADTRLLLHCDTRYGPWLRDSSGNKAHFQILGDLSLREERTKARR